MIDTVRHDIVGTISQRFCACHHGRRDRAHRTSEGKIAALMGIEGGHAIEDSLRLLRDYYALGVRYMTLTHTNTNNWADSSGDIDKPKWSITTGSPISAKQVVREMNRLGMMVDISHVADKTFWDALEVSTAPIIASHSSCRALCNVPRNMTDEMIVALAKKGGVVQINFNCGFLSEKSAEAAQNWSSRWQPPGARGEDAIIEEYRKKVPPATLADVVAHIDHSVKIARNRRGRASAATSTACTARPTGLEDVSKFPNLTRALLEKGYSADRHSQDLRRQYSARDARGGSRGEKRAGRSIASLSAASQQRAASGYHGGSPLDGAAFLQHPDAAGGAVCSALHDNVVRMYTCGPTVYNYVHIGNLRTFTFQDILRRWLRARGYQLDHVMNITDVEDKIIRNAAAEHKTIAEYTEKYTAGLSRRQRRAAPGAAGATGEGHRTYPRNGAARSRSLASAATPI